MNHFRKIFKHLHCQGVAPSSTGRSGFLMEGPWSFNYSNEVTCQYFRIRYSTTMVKLWFRDKVGNFLKRQSLKAKGTFSSKRALFSRKRVILPGKGTFLSAKCALFPSKRHFFQVIGHFSIENEQFRSKRVFLYEKGHNRGWSQGGKLSRSRWALPTLDVR